SQETCGASIRKRMLRVRVWTTFNSRARGRGGKNETAAFRGPATGKFSGIFLHTLHASSIEFSSQRNHHRNPDGSERRSCNRRTGDCGAWRFGGPGSRGGHSHGAERARREICAGACSGTLPRKDRAALF